MATNKVTQPTMRPKGKMIALLAIFAAIGLVVATGAFTSVSAERTVTIETAGDASANLGIAPAGGSNPYVTAPGSGIVSLDFTSVNLRADTDFGAVLNLTDNTGSTDLHIQIATNETQLQNAGVSYQNDSNMIGDVSGAPSFEFTDSGGNDITLGSSSELNPGTGGSANVHVTISVDSTTADGPWSGSIVIVAQDSSLTS